MSQNHLFDLFAGFGLKGALAFGSCSLALRVVMETWIYSNRSRRKMVISHLATLDSSSAQRAYKSSTRRWASCIAS